MNTKVTYLYRDASNYKNFNTVILAGEMTREHVRRITARMNDEYFIPRDVGLPEQRITDYRTDDDHCWFEWELGESDDGELYGFELTDETPTINMTVDELAQRFEAVQKWDETSWEDDYEYKSYDELFLSDEDKDNDVIITEKIIRRGLAKAVVKINDSPNDGEPACQIGDYWFYFAGMEGKGKSAEEYLAHSDIDDVIREITDAINSLDETERGYYASLLNEAGITVSTTCDDMSMSEANAKIRTQFGPDAPTLCAYLEDDDTIWYRYYYYDGIEMTWNGYSSVEEAYAGLKELLQ